MKSDRHILFIHIPKTAGTSFRLAAKQFYGEKNVFFDYAPESIETSGKIIETMYEQKDPFLLYQELGKRSSSLLSGHFPEKKYAMLYDAANIISFVREPVGQVVSHYNHHVQYLDYQKTLADFIIEQRFQNLQSRLLSSRNIGLYGFLGITEKYNESIEIFNESYGTDLHCMYENRVDKELIRVQDIDDALLQTIRHLNSHDMQLYASVSEQFAIRKKLHEHNKPFTLGMIQKRHAGMITGCAFRTDSSNAVEIEIYHQDQMIATLTANLYKPGLKNQGVPRKGFVGFQFKWDDKSIKSQNIHCIVKETGQEI